MERAADIAAFVLQVGPPAIAASGAAFLILFMSFYATRGIYRYVRRGIVEKDWSYP